MSIDIKTKVVQHVERVNERVKVLKVVKVKDFESQSLTFDHRHENKSGSACRERMHESVKVLIVLKVLSSENKWHFGIFYLGVVWWGVGGH